MKWLVRTVGVFLLVVAAVGLWKREEISRLATVLSLFSEEKIVHNFSHMDEAFHSAPLGETAGLPASLPAGAPFPEGVDLAPWLDARTVTGLVVLKDGMIREERYLHGTAAEDLRISWSMAKSFVSALTGILLAEGALESIDVDVTTLAPSLKGSAYDGTTLRNVLQMQSGIRFDEDYLKFSSDINKMGRVLALGGSMDAFAAARDVRARPAGERWEYVSIDTHVVGMALRGATGRSMASLLSEKLIAPLGLEAEPRLVQDAHGVGFVLGGVLMRTRDYARFGQMILQNGRFNGQQIVPASWVEESTLASANTAQGEEHYGYQWWLAADPRPGEVFARGIYGQYIYINRPAGVVIAVNSADRAFREAGAYEQNLSMFRAIVDALDEDAQSPQASAIERSEEGQ